MHLELQFWATQRKKRA